ncbi:MAG: sugar phosphate isomerase/epimerase family protein [Candidatus Fimadaptatus sp.]
MNRIGVMAESFAVGVPKGMEMAAQVGAAAVQVYVGGRGATQSVWTGDYRREILKKARDCGQVISAMCGDLGGHAFEGRAENDEWRIDEVKRMFDLCLDMDCTILTNHIGRVPADPAHPRYAVMVDAMQRIDRLGRESGCRLAIETGPETPATLKRFLDDIGGSNIGINFDPANLKMVMDVDAAEGVRTLGSHILHTHAKDGKIYKFMGGEEVYGIFCDGGIEDLQKLGDYFEEVPLGEGDVNWDGYIKALDEVGYQGYFTIERECGADPATDIRLAVAFLRKLLG